MVGVPVTPYDIVALNVTRTEQSTVPGTAATAAMFFRGSDLGLSTAVNIGGLTVTTAALPVISLSQSSVAATEAAAPLVLDAGLTVADADSATLASARVAIGAGYAGVQDQLAFTPSGGTGNISASYVGGVLSLGSAGATATLAQWQAALRSVTYQNTSQAPSTAARTVTFTLNDGLADSATKSLSLTVAAVNNPPTVTVPTGAATDQNQELQLEDALKPVVADVDAGAANLQLTLTASTGTLKLAGTSGLSFVTGDGNRNATMTFVGTLANINAALDGLKFVPGTNFNSSTGGPARIDFSLNDLGNTGSGGAIVHQHAPCWSPSTRSTRHRHFRCRVPKARRSRRP